MTGSSLHLVCVPGLGLETTEWRSVARSLGRLLGTDVVAQALPGYGVRPVAGEDLGPAALGTRLAIDLPHRTVLVGHSASCQLVARAAAVVPGRVAAVVLVGPTTDPRAASWPRLTARWLRTAVRERPWQVPLLARSYARTGLLWMRRAMEVARHHDIRRDLCRLTAPVLVVRGQHDRISTSDWVGELASLAPAGSAAATLPAGGHMVPITHGDLLAEAIAGWLDGLPSEGG
jgi:pimeloyl-ACP methyl ester carboxylesterase